LTLTDEVLNIELRPSWGVDVIME